MDQICFSSPSDLAQSIDSFPSDLVDVGSFGGVLPETEDMHPHLQLPATPDRDSSIQSFQANPSIPNDTLKGPDDTGVVCHIQSGFFAEPEKVLLLLRALSRMESPDYNKMLLSLALTCKAIYEPAMDILWENMDISLLRLLKLLPAFKVIDGVYVISGLVTTDDVNRFKCYASRVKTISLEEVHVTPTPMLSAPPQVTHDAWGKPIPLPTSPLAPPSPPMPLPISQMVYIRLAQLLRIPTSSLHQLRLKRLDSYIQHISLLVAPSLETLEVSNTFNEGNYVEEALLENVLSVVPSLKHITFSSDMDPSTTPLPAPDKTDLLCRFIAKYRDIRTLNISGFFKLNDFSVLDAIGELPHLNDFTLKVQQVEYSKREASDALRFRSLRKLHITAPSDVIQDLLQASQGACLENVAIIQSGYPPVHVSSKKKSSKKLPKRQETIDHYTPNPLQFLTSYRQTLHSFSITCHLDGYMPDTYVQMLSQLSSLEYFEALGVTLSNEQLTYLVNQWPRIKSIKLPLHSTPVPSLNFNNFLAITRYCPNLRMIQCDIKFDADDALPDLSSLDSISPHGLELLMVNNDPGALLPQHIRQIALYIISVFPRLRIVTSDISSSAPLSRQWEEILDLMAFYREARFWSDCVMRRSKSVAEFSA